MTVLEALGHKVGRLVAAELLRALGLAAPPPEGPRLLRAEARPLRALRFLQARAGRMVDPGELGAHLGIGNQAAAVILRRLAIRGMAERCGTGLYRARTNGVERAGENPRSHDAVGDRSPIPE